MATKIKPALTGGLCSVAVIIGLVLDTGDVRTNKRGLELIGNAEACRRDPYHCPAGILTDGIGNTQGVKVGAHKTDKQIADDWDRNILAAERCVNRYANGKALPDNTFAAAVELTFNVGCPTMENSTFYNLLKQGDLRAACNELPRWVYSNGTKLKGLLTRREKSKALCLDGLK